MKLSGQEEKNASKIMRFSAAVNLVLHLNFHKKFVAVVLISIPLVLWFGHLKGILGGNHTGLLTSSCYLKKVLNN